jgi:tRNA(Arg) A34 adenosine deaminase TadA
VRVVGVPRTEPDEAAAAYQTPATPAPAAATDAVSSGEVSTAEWVCLELAWQALLAGAAPIGAVITDATGAIIGTGRNAVDGDADPPLVSGSLLAHAEVNALIWLRDGRQRHADYRLVSSLEPCPMCTGAFRMAGLGALTFLGADPFNGATWVLTSDRYVGRRPVDISGPRDDRFGRLAAGLIVAYQMRRRPGGPFIAAHRELRPDLLAAGEGLVEAGLFERADRQAPWPEVADSLLAAV